MLFTLLLVGSHAESVKRGRFEFAVWDFFQRQYLRVNAPCPELMSQTRCQPLNPCAAKLRGKSGYSGFLSLFIILDLSEI